MEAARKAADRSGWVFSLASAVVTKADGDERRRSAGTMAAAPHHVGSELILALWSRGRIPG